MGEAYVASGRRRAYRFGSIPVGQSVLYPHDGREPASAQKLVTSAVGRWSQRNGGRFTTRRSTVGIRVFRIA
jgi:hypothetical protein